MLAYQRVPSVNKLHVDSVLKCLEGPMMKRLHDITFDCKETGAALHLCRLPPGNDLKTIQKRTPSTSKITQSYPNMSKRGILQTYPKPLLPPPCLMGTEGSLRHTAFAGPCGACRGVARCATGAGGRRAMLPTPFSMSKQNRKVIWGFLK